MSTEKFVYECSECGTSVSENATTCPQCGQSLVEPDGNIVFCPTCRTEYTKNHTICTDCGATLVASLEPVPQTEYIEFEQILSTFNAADIAFIKSMLDGEGVSYYFNGEFFNAIDPLIQPARLMVRKDQVETAREILKGVEVKVALSLNDDPIKETGENIETP